MPRSVSLLGGGDIRREKAEKPFSDLRQMPIQRKVPLKGGTMSLLFVVFFVGVMLAILTLWGESE